MIIYKIEDTIQDMKKSLIERLPHIGRIYIETSDE